MKLATILTIDTSATAALEAPHKVIMLKVPATMVALFSKMYATLCNELEAAGLPMETGIIGNVLLNSTTSEICLNQLICVRLLASCQSKKGRKLPNIDSGVIEKRGGVED
jgi:hypothetical protein